MGIGGRYLAECRHIRNKTRAPLPHPSNPLQLISYNHQIRRYSTILIHHSNETLTSSHLRSFPRISESDQSLSKTYQSHSLFVFIYLNNFSSCNVPPPKISLDKTSLARCDKYKTRSRRSFDCSTSCPTSTFIDTLLDTSLLRTSPFHRARSFTIYQSY